MLENSLVLVTQGVQADFYRAYGASTDLRPTRHERALGCVAMHTRAVHEPTYDSPRYRWASPAPAAYLIEAETALGSLLPDPLAALYRANDGLFDAADQWWVIWPLSQMVEAKAWLAPFDGYLERWVPFGDDGTGDPFCFHRADQLITRLSMIHGTHETFAHGLADFWTMATILKPNGPA